MTEAPPATPDARPSFESRPTFEDRPVLTGAEAVEALATAAQAGDEATRAWLLRLAVVQAEVAQALVAAVPSWLDHADAAVRAVGLQVAHGLCARQLTAEVARCLTARAPQYVGVADPLGPLVTWTGAVGKAAPTGLKVGVAGTLAERALRYLVEVPVAGSAAARPGLAAALLVPALRVAAARHLIDEDPAALVPHLAHMLTEDPTLAGPLGTRFALVHAELAVAAAQAAAAAPEPARLAFAADLEKHLRRVFAIKTWVLCRQALFGH